MDFHRFSKPPTLITSLPDELIIDIIARVPISNYPTISLVSRRFRSTIASPELYRRRSLLQCTEHCLYALLYNSQTRDYRWYIRRRNGFVLIPSLPPMPAHGSFVSVGSKIYVLGGVYSSGVTSTVLTIDCTTHTMQHISNIPKLMGDTVAGIIDGKIYVIGLSELSKDKNSKGIMVFNTKTGIWEPEMIKLGFEIGRLWPGCVVMEGKIYMRDVENSFVYEPREDKWEREEMLNSKKWEYACVVDDILYYYDVFKKILRAYDIKHKCWREVEGVGRLLPEPSRALWSYTVSYGGKLAVFLPKEIHKKNTTEIWCAEIALERRQGGGILGNVEWGGVVIDGDFFYVRCLSVLV
ncbi:F-box/kelch-repeat protein [Cardamine amara subsp. amara]|uniref:F-box/kelch-repeat protein n=1 Tax=Cardamine amara subsp. amara TaxID=228776 RepID=A0ABD1C900_CARAN